MDQPIKMSEYQIRFYKEEEYSFSEEQALWDNKKELSDEMLKRTFCTIADDIEDVIKTSEEPFNEFGANTYLDEGDMVNFLSYCDADNKMYFTLFSNLNYIFKWIQPSESSYLPEITIKHAFEMVVDDYYYAGVIINPCSTHWIITTEDILNYLNRNNEERTNNA
ncbi:MAG TPA: hypothetical protein VIK29_09720 [Paludibacter sp.]